MSEDTQKNMQELFETAQRMQQQLGKVHGELAQKTVEGAAGGGMVVAVVNGRQQVVSLQIDPEVVDVDDVGMLQDLVVAAVNQGLAKSSELAQEEMSKLAGQMNGTLPGLL